MISSKDIEAYSYLISDRFEAINTHYIKLMANQIKEIGRLGPANLHRLNQMSKFQQNVDEIKNLLSQETGKTIKELEQLFDLSGMSVYGDYAEMYMNKGVKQVPFKDNMAIQGYLNSVKTLTQGTFLNMANTTVISDDYKNLVDLAIDTVATGQSNYNDVIRRHLIQASGKGLSVTYASGRTRRLDSAVRMNILEGVRKVNEGVRYVAGQEFGNDGWELSAHALCAEDHIHIQGKQFAVGRTEKTIGGITYPAYDIMNEQLRRHIGTCNCKHSRYPIILGISTPAYTDQELQKFRDNSEEQVTITTGYNKDGTPRTKQVTKYEGTQYQRNFETEIRRAKDIHIALSDAGDDTGASEQKSKILALRKMYANLSNEIGLTPKWDRTFVAGYTGRQTKPKPIIIKPRTQPPTPQPQPQQKPKIVLPQRLVNAFGGYTNTITKLLENTGTNFRNKFLDIANRTPLNQTTDNRAFFSPRNKSVTMNTRKVAKGDSIHAPYQTLFHEMGHALDDYMKTVVGQVRGKGWTHNVSDDYEFFATLKEEADILLGHKVWDDAEYLEVLVKDSGLDLMDFRKYLYTHQDPNIVQAYNDLESWARQNFIFREDLKYKRKLVAIIGKDEVYQLDWFNKFKVTDKPYRRVGDKTSKQNETNALYKLRKKYPIIGRGDISDMLEPHTLNAGSAFPLGAGHGKSYWHRSDNSTFRSMVCTEAFAEMYSATIANPDSLKAIKECFPKSYDRFVKIIGGL